MYFQLLARVQSNMARQHAIPSVQHSLGMTHLDSYSIWIWRRARAALTHDFPPQQELDSTLKYYIGSGSLKQQSV